MRTRLALVSLTTLVLFGVPACGGNGGGPDAEATREAASSLCSHLQEWIDDLEQISKELSDRTTSDSDSRRRDHFRVWIDDVDARTEALRDDVERLDLAGATVGIDEGLRILADTDAEISAMPEQDRESLGYRVARAFLSLENVFAKVRTSVERLGSQTSNDVLSKALAEEPACADYNDPLT